MKKTFKDKSLTFNLEGEQNSSLPPPKYATLACGLFWAKGSGDPMGLRETTGPSLATRI